MPKFLPVHTVSKRTHSTLPGIAKHECQNPAKPCSICCSTTKTAGDCMQLLYWGKHIVHDSEQNWRKHKQAKSQSHQRHQRSMKKTLSATWLSHCSSHSTTTSLVHIPHIPSCATSIKTLIAHYNNSFSTISDPAACDCYDHFPLVSSS